MQKPDRSAINSPPSEPVNSAQRSNIGLERGDKIKLILQWLQNDLASIWRPIVKMTR